jgi:hypothetical protein
MPPAIPPVVVPGGMGFGRRILGFDVVAEKSRTNLGGPEAMTGVDPAIRGGGKGCEGILSWGGISGLLEFVEAGLASCSIFEPRSCPIQVVTATLVMIKNETIPRANRLRSGVARIDTVLPARIP